MNISTWYSKWKNSLPDKAREEFEQIEKPKRSTRQNRYYWKILIGTLADFIGEHKDDVHEMMKAKFNTQSKQVAFEIIEYGGSSKRLTTVEFEQYQEEIRIWANREFALNIPKPNEVPDSYWLSLDK